MKLLWVPESHSSASDKDVEAKAIILLLTLCLLCITSSSATNTGYDTGSAPTAKQERAAARKAAEEKSATDEKADKASEANVARVTKLVTRKGVVKSLDSVAISFSPSFPPCLNRSHCEPFLNICSYR